VQLSKMVVEVHSKFNSICSLKKERAKPDYATFIKISIDALLKKTITPGILVMLTPLIAATFFRFRV
jgi:Na+/H+-translocating membrane pyrophosphatase